LVTGGSVTLGTKCGTNPVGIPAPGGKEFWVNTPCTWASRLQNLFNEALFKNKSVVKVTNIAAGGASSEIAKVVLEYQLMTEEVKKVQPHVVIWSHAPNDAQESDMNAIFYTHLPGFVNAARNLNLCDEQLPMVIMLEDFYGYEDYSRVNMLSGYLSKLSSWYGLMNVNQANVINHELWSNYDNSTRISYILGSEFELHSGMGNHVGVAWTLFFNFLSAFTDSCTDGLLGVGIPASSMPLKFLGPYDESGSYRMIQSTWQTNQDRARNHCSKQQMSKERTEPCTYAFMANAMSGVNNVAELQAKMADVLKASDGWDASGFPKKQPKIGWYASKHGASFSLRIEVKSDTNFLTIMSMKSYGPNFVDTILNISVQIVRKGDNQQALASSSASYEITGYHETRTSIHVPHKFELPGGGARAGDSILLDGKLTSGAYFKINGLALCSF